MEKLNTSSSAKSPEAQRVIDWTLSYGESIRKYQGEIDPSTSSLIQLLLSEWGWQNMSNFVKGETDMTPEKFVDGVVEEMGLRVISAIEPELNS
jgi:hypothetical protein